MTHVIERAIGAALIAVGSAAVIAPAPVAVLFGIPAEAAAHPYVRATGARDIILGGLVLASIGEPPALRRTLAWTSLIGAADALLLLGARGPRWQHVNHLFGFAALALVAFSRRP